MIFLIQKFILIIKFYQKYKEWKDGLPDMEWIKDFIPDPEKQKLITDNLNIAAKKLFAENGLFDSITKNANKTLEQFQEMLKERQKRSEGIQFSYSVYFNFCGWIVNNVYHRIAVYVR